MKVLCIIPARGESRSVKNKNLASIGGKTLIEHAAVCIKKSNTIERAVVSTDSPGIADAARRCSLEVPFMRPKELAEDETTDWPVFYHCLTWLKEHESYAPDIVVHLRVTSPFAFKRVDVEGGCFGGRWKYMEREKVIDEVVQELIKRKECDSIRSVEVVRDTPFKMWQIENGKLRAFIKSDGKELYNQPRQKLPTVYLQNGYVDVSRYGTIMDKQSMSGNEIGAYILDCDYFVDIDHYADIEIGELLYNEIMGKGSSNEDKR